MGRVNQEKRGEKADGCRNYDFLVSGLQKEASERAEYVSKAHLQGEREFQMLQLFIRIHL